MKKPRSTEELATRYKEGRLPLDVALDKHLRNLGLSAVSDTDFMAIQLAIGFGNLGLADKPVVLSGDRKLTVAEVIDEFKLRPFLEIAKDNP